MATSSGNQGNRVVNDLGKRLLEAARKGYTDEVSKLMINGAPLTADWVCFRNRYFQSVIFNCFMSTVLHYFFMSL